jgi:hypothetical protein
MAHLHLHTCLRALLLGCVSLALLAPAAAHAAPPPGSDTGGAQYVPPPPPAKRAKIHDGIAIPPAGAPARVKRAIAAANRIVRKPYVYGGGHGPFTGRSASSASLDRGYDCSGAISFALFGGKFLSSPLNSSGFMGWGRSGKGRWITVYTNPGHAYVVIAGLRFDTSGGDRVTPRESASGRGPRWRTYSRSPTGFSARHLGRF